MPQSFKNAWRWLVGASAAAMLIASIAPAVSADTGVITLCVARNGKIVGVDIECKPHNIQLTWNIAGPEGLVGPAGPTGPAGVQGAPGPTGSQGAVGAVGPTGPMGAQGITGPAGEQGVTGPTGPTGNAGEQGPAGPEGAMGVAGTNGMNGDNITTLTGGTLGDRVGGGVPSGAQSDTASVDGGAGIQLTATTSMSAPLYMAPGNAADFVQGTVQVPTPGGCARHLQVQLWTPPGFPGGPGTGNTYTFIVCQGAPGVPPNCESTGVSCTISGLDSTCADDTGSVTFLPGDSLSIMAFNSMGEPRIVNVTWSLDYLYAPTSGCS
jgi:Collagen triple helix repeat (20 copies)